MLVTHIHRLHDEGVHSVEAIPKVALVPVLLRRHAPGSKIQAPMAFAILFGLNASTALNRLVVSTLYPRFGSKV